MKNFRIESHPILEIPERQKIHVYWRDKKIRAREGEVISAALFANGIRTFGYHPKDNSPQGIFCANGQCAQCLVIADGLPAKACMTKVASGMRIQPLKELPVLPETPPVRSFNEIEEKNVDCLIVGAGPAGLSAAIELGKRGVDTLIVDDKDRPGGKLVLQTHRFFGSVNACYAGTRGVDIAKRLSEEVSQFETIQTWFNSTAVAVFSDQKVGIVKEGKRYVLINPKVLLVACGAREKNLTFKGNTLPGVYGAGAFQTLVNRDLIKAAERLFIVGGGNVGLIAGYHALQAGIEVVGLVEALAECGGYKVHKDKLERMGVPIYTSHTVLSANGKNSVESITIAEIDKNWKAIAGTEKSFKCDTILIAVGLDPVNEFYHKAREFGMVAFAAGDADEIAEASAAMYSGKIRGLEILKALGHETDEIPPEWFKTADILKSKPGKITHETVPENQKIFPVLHCSQEIPCNPCTSVCEQGSLIIGDEDLRHVPDYIAEQLGTECIACEKCVNICPGLAITLVNYKKEEGHSLVTIPYEFTKESIKPGDVVTVVNTSGEVLGNVGVARVRSGKATDKTVLVKVRAPYEISTQIAGIQMQEKTVSEPLKQYIKRLTDDLIVCRCERVLLSEIKEIINKGIYDINEIKAITRAGMGACGGKTCGELILRAFRELGIPEEEITHNIHRPMFVEVPLGVIAGANK